MMNRIFSILWRTATVLSIIGLLFDIAALSTPSWTTVSVDLALASASVRLGLFPNLSSLIAAFLCKLAQLRLYLYWPMQLSDPSVRC